ncbi:MAG: hypothetical protein AAF990_01020 [Bacteroidota bacterium]
MEMSLEALFKLTNRPEVNVSASTAPAIDPPQMPRILTLDELCEWVRRHEYPRRRN